MPRMPTRGRTHQHVCQRGCQRVQPHTWHTAAATPPAVPPPRDAWHPTALSPHSRNRAVGPITAVKGHAVSANTRQQQAAATRAPTRLAARCSHTRCQRGCQRVQPRTAPTRVPTCAATHGANPDGNACSHARRQRGCQRVRPRTAPTRVPTRAATHGANPSANVRANPSGNASGNACGNAGAMRVQMRMASCVFVVLCQNSCACNKKCLNLRRDPCGMTPTA